MVYRRTGVDHDKAIAAFQKAEQLAPARTDYFDDYADALRQGVQWTAAESVLRRRLKAAPDDPLAHYMLGMVLLNSNPTPERQNAAEAETREALRLLPHNVLANLQLAQILLAKGQLDEAIGLLQDALKANPFNRNAMTVLARAYRRSGRTDLSDKVSKQADQLYQTQQRVQVLEGKEAKQIMNAAFHEDLARLLEQVGEHQKAIREAEMAKLLRADPRRTADELKKIKATLSEALPAH